MLHSSSTICRSFLLILAMVFMLAIHVQAADKIIEIQVSPNVLNIQSAGEWVTIHTDIAYSAVISASVDLNGVPISWSKSDNQGYFVAKFIMGSIKNLNGLKIGEYNSLTLTGSTADGSFSGTQAIMVIDVTPKK